MDEVDPWLLFRFALTHCWLSKEDSRCLGTTITSGQSLAAAPGEKKKKLLVQKHPPGAEGVIRALQPPRPSPPSHAGSVPTTPARAGDASLLCWRCNAVRSWAGLRCCHCRGSHERGVILPRHAACWACRVEKRVHKEREGEKPHKKRERNPGVWATFALSRITFGSPNSNSLWVCRSGGGSFTVNVYPAADSMGCLFYLV